MAIQQHPVPQDISNYKFRLIGDMTIKQFASLGIAIVLSVMTYSMPLPFFFKYPISFILLLLGIGMAFVPVQGRTLDIWIIAFIKSIYSPTQYIWKQTTDITQSTTSTIQPTPTSQNPTTTTESIPTPPIVEMSSPVVEQTKEVPAPISDPATNPTTQPAAVEEKLPISNTEVSPLAQQTPPQQSLAQEPVVSIPPSEEKPIIQSLPTTPPSNSPVINQNVDLQSLPIPFTPTSPNTLVGLSITPDNHILDGVLIEIKQDNLTIRATKSNKLGQFLFARPLENGLYQILAEKEGYAFPPYSIELNGDIIKPLKIQASLK